MKNLIQLKFRKEFSVILIQQLIIGFFYSNHDLKSRTILIERFKKLVRSLLIRGLPFTTLYLKECRLQITKYQCKEPIRVSSNRVAIDSSGFPKRLSFLKELVDSDKTENLRLVFTIQQYSRAQVPIIDIKSYADITDPCKYAQFECPSDEFMIKFNNEFKLHIEDYQVTSESFFLNQKAGPIGTAIMTCGTSFFFSKCKYLIPLIGQESFDYIVSLIENSRALRAEEGFRNKIDKRISRRLSFVKETEGKTRVVAIFDYQTQVCLDGLSKQVFNLLKKLPQDRTFTQNPLIKIKPGNSFHSLDQKAFTDRFPLTLQAEYLTTLIGREKAKSWWLTMVGSDFLTPCGQLIRYGCGQPMGARSSWAVCTLTHHQVVQYAAEKIGQFPTSDYILLGDDIVITNDKQAKSYRSYIEGLGVEIQSAKSHVSVDSYEFAKRWFHKGIEITGIPIRGFVENRYSLKQILALFIQIQERGYGSPDFRNYVDFMKRWVHMLNPVKKFSRQDLIMCNDYVFMYRMSKGLLTNEELRSFIANSTKDSEYIIPSSEVGLLNELSRVYQVTISRVVEDMIRALSSYYESAMNIFPFREFTPYKMSDHPVFIAIMAQMRKVIDHMRENNTFGTLGLLIDGVELQDFESLLPGRKAKNQKILFLSSLAGKLRNQFRYRSELGIAMVDEIRLYQAIDRNASLLIKVGAIKERPGDENLNVDEYL